MTLKVFIVPKHTFQYMGLNRLNSGSQSRGLWTYLNAFNTGGPLLVLGRCIGSTDWDEKPRSEVQQRYLCPCFCNLLQTGKTVFPKLLEHFGLCLTEDLIFFFSPLQIKFSSSEVCFPSGADISILNMFIFRKPKLAMPDSPIMGKAISSAFSLLWHLCR